jgi:hypothetical protein
MIGCPVLLSGGHYSPAFMVIISSVWGFSLAALLMLWLRRLRSVIDVWLMVVLCAWLFDIALSAILNVARFDLGFYAGRLYGLCAAPGYSEDVVIHQGRLDSGVLLLVKPYRKTELARMIRVALGS